MKVQHFRSVGAVALSYYSMVAVLLLGRLAGSTASCSGLYYADGDCDDWNNTEECGYDHGDCCEASCVDGDFVCGENGFNCLDPDYRDDYPQQSSYSYSYDDDWDWCHEELDGNGNCDWGNNSEECGYDGGDCCEESCVDNDFLCGENLGFDCLDPEYSNHFEDDDFSYSYDWTSCENERIGDAFCDEQNNNPSCGYDGGDCCKDSCVDTDNDYICGYNSSYYCIDPAYSEETIPSHLCRPERSGNGLCDDRNNNPECGYDGGDCCEESCVDGDFRCADTTVFYCVDPDYTEEEFPWHLCNPGTRGNGYCDSQNNKPECGYDDGDCCEESCVDSGEYKCADSGVFYCVDPEYSEEEYPWHLCNPDTTGNGYCDGQNNKLECGYDDGDCCEESCVDGDYSCGADDDFFFYCLDPDYASEDDDYPEPDDGSCQDENIGNGYCDPGNNNEDCGYDGGDCCSCTCPNVPSISCGGLAGGTCIDTRAPCLDGYVEAGTLTTVTVTTSLFDTVRIDNSHDECPPEGCRPELTRDGEVDDQTSRWSCTDSENNCVIMFSFAEPVVIRYIQVAFYRADELPRGLEVKTNGEDIARFESSPESTFTVFRLDADADADAVETVTLTSSSGAFENEGISILEVRFLVEDPDI